MGETVQPVHAWRDGRFIQADFKWTLNDDDDGDVSTTG